MPIAWRRSIRQTASSSNPVQFLAGAVLAAAGAVVNGAVVVAAFPFVAAGKGVGAAKSGGVKGTAVTLLALSLVTAVLVTSSALGERWPELSGPGILCVLGGFQSILFLS